MTTNISTALDETRRIPEEELCDRLARSLRGTSWSTGSIADAMGVNRDTVSRWTNGRTKPSRPALMVWAGLTNVDLDWLLYGIRDSNPEPADSDSGPILTLIQGDNPGLSVNRLPGSPRPRPVVVPDSGRLTVVA